MLKSGTGLGFPQQNIANNVLLTLEAFVLIFAIPNMHATFKIINKQFKINNVTISALLYTRWAFSYTSFRAVNETYITIVEFLK